VDSQVAAKGIVVDGQGRILLLKRAGKQWWDAPGGRLESGELLYDGLVRELREETGLADVTIGDVLHADEWSPEINGKPQHIVGIFFVCKTVGTPTVVISDEHEDFAWIAPEELKNYDIASAPKQAIERLLHGG
jgi:8-oxo-dGTP pyrophosphatase MutT (NUDIX family)